MERPIRHPPSAWCATATSSDEVSFPHLPGDRDTDVLIVGGGFTGLSTARELLARDVDCVVLEERDIGWGASGRTGGFMVPRYKANFSHLAEMFGNDMALSLYREVMQAVEGVAETVREFDIDCDFQRGGHMVPAHSTRALAGLEADRDWISRNTDDAQHVRILSREETRAALGTDRYCGAYVDARGGCIHPYKYTRGLARALVERGVPIFGGTGVDRLERDGARWVARTASGRVRARHVILATNGYTRSLASGDDLYRRLVPVASSIVATEPLSEAQLEQTLPCRLPISDTRRVLRYFRLLPTGQLLFGGRGDITGRRTDDPASYHPIERQMQRVFPHLAGIGIAQRWSGMVAVTRDGFPHLGYLDENVLFAVGYSGRGVVLTRLMGRYLVDAVTGTPPPRNPMTESTLSPVPFHAWRRTGMRIMASYYSFLDNLER